MHERAVELADGESGDDSFQDGDEDILDFLVIGHLCDMECCGESFESIGGVTPLGFDLVVVDLPPGECDGGIDGELAVGCPVCLDVLFAGHGAPLVEALCEVVVAIHAPCVDGVFP